MKKNLIFWIGLILVLSLCLFVFGEVYKNTLPKLVEEINNSAIGAILTAFITVLLLSKQSASEEIKERNVKVFEEKSANYKKLIDKIWSIWEDKRVTLEEVRDLLDFTSKNIVLYLNNTDTQEIYAKIEKLASFAENENLESSKLVQNELFEIINILAKDINLGGQLSANTISSINQIEEKILPVIKRDNFKKAYFESLKTSLKKELGRNISFTDFEEFCGYKFFFINNFNPAIYIGIWGFYDSEYIEMSLCFDRDEHPFLRNYAEAQRKDFYNSILKGGYKTLSNTSVNFEDKDCIDNHIESRTLEDSNKEENPTHIAKKIKEFLLEEWSYEGMSFDEFEKEIVLKNTH